MDQGPITMIICTRGRGKSRDCQVIHSRMCQVCNEPITVSVKTSEPPHQCSLRFE